LVALIESKGIGRRCNQGRSAVSISSLANGALGEHRRHDTDGMRLGIAIGLLAWEILVPRLFGRSHFGLSVISKLF
jgi:hypothetical protein